MSLKAKIEAVIYAAEEPVTLAQLVGLLGHEAQTELDRIASVQQTLSLYTAFDGDDLPLSANPDDLNGEIFAGADPLSDPGDLPQDSLGSQDILGSQDPLGSQDTLGSQGSLDPQDTLDPQDALDPIASSPGQTSSNPDAALPAFHPDLPPDLPPDPLPADLRPGTPPDAGDPAAASAEQTSNPKHLARNERERARALRDFLRSLLDELIRDYATSDRGLEIREVAGGFRLSTKPEYHDAVRGFVKALKPPLKLSLQALETLAVVAYKQPVTAPEISEIRGVDSGGVLGSLMARKLITTAGRKHVIGRPILYKTTKDFLLRFGLKDINELPSIEEFEKMAGELADNEPVSKPFQEEIPMPPENPHTDPELARGEEFIETSITGANLEQERGAVEPQADGDGATVETVTPDGRLSGISPPPDPAGDTNTSAQEAGIQGSQRNN